MAERKVSHLRIVAAAVLDFLTVFFIGGYLIASFTGETTGDGFNLNGTSALLLFALIVVYFFGARFIGGTLWQRILRTR